MAIFYIEAHGGSGCPRVSGRIPIDACAPFHGADASLLGGARGLTPSTK